ncbi:MAG: hypothetical protein GQ535_15600 [Rhodobacteraceae bacterium]|nr:hypothetical protein [Paracoccaceae bacterium]
MENPFLRVALQDFAIMNQSVSPIYPNMDIEFDTLLLNAAATNRTIGAPYPWQIEARLEGLKLSPETWAMIDPTTALPHGPSHFVAKLNGIGERLDQGAEISPFLWLPEMRALALETLDVNFGGLVLLASGAVSFQEDTVPLYALPTPNGGQISLRMQGAQMLLNALETGPMSTLFPSNILRTTAPTGQSPDDLDMQILFDEQGGISVD